MKLFIITEHDFRSDDHWHYVVAANDKDDALILAMDDDDRVREYSDIIECSCTINTDTERVISGVFWYTD